MRLSTALHWFGVPEPVGPVHAEQVPERSEMFAVQQLFRFCLWMLDWMEGSFVQWRRGRVCVDCTLPERCHLSEHRWIVQMCLCSRIPGPRLRNQHWRMRFLWVNLIYVILLSLNHLIFFILTTYNFYNFSTLSKRSHVSGRYWWLHLYVFGWFLRPLLRSGCWWMSISAMFEWSHLQAVREFVYLHVSHWIFWHALSN